MSTRLKTTVNVVLALVWAHTVYAHRTDMVSVSSSGVQGNARSLAPAISADGRIVAFTSEASNLVAGDTNGFRDVFVHDAYSGITSRVSVSSTGQQGNGNSGELDGGVAVSADGRYVAFTSYASNLVADDTNGESDVFVHDRETGETTRVSVDSTGAQGDGPSSLDGSSGLSADGRYVAFLSYATNLVPDDTNNSRDVFVHDRETGITVRVSIDSNGAQLGGGGPSISADGRFVAFSHRITFVPVLYVHDRDADDDGIFDEPGGIETIFTGEPTDYCSISGSGRYVAYHLVSDVPFDSQVYVYDIETGVRTLASGTPGGEWGNGSSLYPSISTDARYVAFQSSATDLVPGDNNNRRDIFVHDMQTGETTLASVNASDEQGNGDSSLPSISADGRFVAFQSSADNLVTMDINGVDDVFLRDRVGPGPGIPTVSAWGLAALCLLVLAAGTVAIRRRDLTHPGIHGRY